jgi:hypothetical protein
MIYTSSRVYLYIKSPFYNLNSQVKYQSGLGFNSREIQGSRGNNSKTQETLLVGLRVYSMKTGVSYVNVYTEGVPRILGHLIPPGRPGLDFRNL